MSRRFRLRDAEARVDVAYTELARAEEGQDTQARRIRESPKRACECGQLAIARPVPPLTLAVLYLP